MITRDISRKIEEMAKKHNISALAVSTDYINQEEKWFNREVNKLYKNNISYNIAFDIVQSKLSGHLFNVLERYYNMRYKK